MAIDQMDTGQHFIKFHLGQPQFYHSSEGVGDGIISLFVIATALYELFPPPPQRVVVIDEPELSLHPYYQRRLRMCCPNCRQTTKLSVPLILRIL